MQRWSYCVVVEEAVVVVWFWETVWRTEEGERQEEAVYIGFTSADTAVVSLRVKSTHRARDPN